MGWWDISKFGTNLANVKDNTSIDIPWGDLVTGEHTSAMESLVSQAITKNLDILTWTIEPIDASFAYKRDYIKAITSNFVVDEETGKEIYRFSSLATHDLPTTGKLVFSEGVTREWYLGKIVIPNGDTITFTQETAEGLDSVFFEFDVIGTLTLTCNPSYSSYMSPSFSNGSFKLGFGVGQLTNNGNKTYTFTAVGDVTLSLLSILQTKVL
jgi:hypothetical protein